MTNKPRRVRPEDRTPGPDEIQERVRMIKADLDRLVEEYRWAYNAGYGASSGSGIIGGGSRGQGGGPTEAALISEQAEKMRSKCRTATDGLIGVAASAREAANAVTVRYRFKDVIGGPEPPQTLRRGEYEESVSAKKRRLSRGEDFGEA